MVKLTSHAGPLRTRPAEPQSQDPVGPKRASVRTLRRLAIFVGIPGTYVVAAALGRNLGLAEERSIGSDPFSGRRLLWEEGDNCTPPAIDEFPTDIFNRELRQRGAIALHLVIACYLFVLFAVICDDYFVPSIKKLCKSLDMSDDVAGATFMAAATSSPELFINLVGTFLTEGDIGVGAVVGSAVFNILAVPACCGLFAGTVVLLDWWPVTRDCFAYAITVVLLIFTLRDGRVEWHEALLLVILYLAYLLAVCYNGYLQRRVQGWWSARQEKRLFGEKSPLLKKETGDNIANHCVIPGASEEKLIANDEEIDEDDDISELSLSSWPKDCGPWERFWWVFVWPISLLLYLTVPDCRQERWKKYYMVTFLTCIVWIAVTSYLVAWMITVIGDTLQIPDSVMGLTFLAAGMSVPEAVSSVIVTKQGHGAMGISNSLGSNVFDILLCLGLPWLIKAAFFPLQEGNHYVLINSGGLQYSAISLFSTLMALYVTFLISGFKLDWKVGLTCLILYAIYLVLATLIELNVFYVVNLPACT